jgi:GH15 family glucan-1,4-alpha-glucosidase
MALRLEDYALIGDQRSAALVGRDGSIDWLCLPRFDSPSCLSALLGSPADGRWLLSTGSGSTPVARRYRPGSMVLETEIACSAGTVRITDAMAVHPSDHQNHATGDGKPTLVRIVEALHGSIEMHSLLNPRFEYGTRPPLWREEAGRCWAVAGPAGLSVHGDVAHSVTADGLEAHFTVTPGQPVALSLTWTGLTAPGERADPHALLRDTDSYWRRWSARCRYRGPYREAVVRSLLTLKALTYAPSGGIVAAPTTSLPEQLGGSRNWDYRYCWLRDATFTLLALFDAGYVAEARAWREWLLRAVAGDPAQLQILYGLAGERDTPERDIALPGYAHSRPVRIGNAASGQVQLDVYGEVMDSLHQAREHRLAVREDAWAVQRSLLDVLESHWQDTDRGIWEVRGAPQHFVHSKVMAWTAVDRAIAAVERHGLDGPLTQWKRLRHEIHAQVCDKGFDTRRKTFTQSYGSNALDAAVLLIPAVGFLPARHPMVTSTVKAVEADLLDHGLLRRYDPNTVDDGVGDGAGRVARTEGAFLPCTFWLADAHALAGRYGRATQLYEQLLDLRNDVGLLSEEYDTRDHRLVGNFPQALSHVPIVNTATLLARRSSRGHRAANRSRSRS